MSMKIPQQFDDEKFMLKIKSIHDIIGEEKLGIHIPSDVDKQISKYQNFGLLALGMDTTILIDGLNNLEKY